MVSYIAPVAHQLGLEKEKTERLESEIKRLNGELIKTRLENDALRKQLGMTPKPSRLHLRPTAASANRTRSAALVATPKPPPATLCKGNSGKTYIFNDANLVDVTHMIGADLRADWGSMYSFHQATVSSSRKTRSKVIKANPRSSTPIETESAFEPDELESTTFTESDDEEDTTTLLDDVSETTDSVEPTLALEKITRLHEVWQNKALSFVKIPSDIGWDLMTEAHHVIAKGAFYDYSKKHVPELQRKKFPGGKQEVLLEYHRIDEYISHIPMPPLENHFNTTSK
ncbi:hypothetical protein PG997_010178 [Apiospora hydei]|uniref:Uncharacterized protein n=1 Tax=Apiospora hydei TaxID=1337664 RepID=A0ABR1VZC3_9PEZI